MASNDPLSPAVTAVEHTEGTSYVVAFGDPARYPLPNSENYFCERFPAAGGENPYQPEMGNMAQFVSQLMPEDASAAPDGPMTMALMMSMGKAIAAFRLPILRNDHSPPSLFTRSCPNQTTLGPVILALRLHSAVDTNMVLVDPA